jgi:uncharacterized protein YbjT (DUF2867 family)
MAVHPRVLAIGAAGRVAGLVVPELVRRGAQVRGLVRRREDAELVRAKGAVDVAVGDLGDRGSVDAALRGMDAVFYIAPVFMADEASVGERVVAAAKAAGVRRIVFSSVIHPVLSELVNHAAKAPVEAAILAGVYVPASDGVLPESRTRLAEDRADGRDRRTVVG